MTTLNHLDYTDTCSQHSVGSTPRGEITRITFCSAEQVRARRVVTRSRARSTGKYPSWKMGRMVQWESRNELLAFRLLDCDPAVRVFREQPCEIVFVQDGIERSHFPDAYVETSNSKDFWEIKCKSQALQPGTVARTRLLQDGLRQYGFTYRVVLDCDLAKQPRLQNVDILLRFGRRPLTKFERESVYQDLKSSGSVCWSDLCGGAYGAKGRAILCRLVLEGVLTFDIDCLLSPNTRFVHRKQDA